jgi:hypothetical protein
MKSALAESAVDGQSLPSDEIRCGQEKQYSIGDFIGSPRAAGGGFVDQAARPLVRFAEQDHARRDRIHGDLRREGFSQRAGHHDDPRLRRAVVRVVRPRPDTAQRAEVNDASAVGREHAPPSLLAAEKGRLQVDGVNEIPVGFGDFERIDGGESRGVVHQTIQRPGVFKQPLDLGDAFEIGAKDGRIAALFSGRPSVGFRMVVMNNDTRAFPRQAQGDGAADALGRSGRCLADIIGEPGCCSALRTYS